MARTRLPKTVWQSSDESSLLLRGDQLQVMQELPDESFECIWTDPPYLLSNDGTTCIAGKRTSVNKGGWDRSQGIDADHAFNLEWLAQCHRLLTPAGTIWVSGTHHIYLSVGMALQQLGFRLLNDIVWEKPNPPPNLGCRCFTHATEMLLWATKAPKGSQHRYTFNYQEMKRRNDNKQMKNVWRFTAPGSDEKLHGKHPTQKPLALIEQCLAASTEPGDRVFDPFTGSGSTGVAALALGRRFVGCEIDAKYARLAAKRLAAADADAVPAGV
tara:strand:- start:1402 stop:2214 length:813 start_codon:yes stop_codon:yes gene_type:complete